MFPTGQLAAAFRPQYYPDPCRFDDRQRLRHAQSSQPSSARKAVLPTHLPDYISSAMSWQGCALQETDYVCHLSSQQLCEIEQACNNFLASGLSLQDISKTNFQVPSLAGRLASQRSALHRGSGLVLFRGLDPLRFTRKQNVCIFAGLSAYVSECFGMQIGGRVLTHVKDLAPDDSPGGLNGIPAPYCNVELPVHTDAGDVVAMYTLGSTKTGGHGTFASVAAIYNYMARTEPDLLALLFEDSWPLDRPPDGKGCDGKGLYYRRPIMFMNKGTPEMLFSRGAIIRSPRGCRPLDIPNISQVQNDALDAVHFAAMKHIHKIEYRPGDLLFFNNRKLLHGRDAFRDNGSESRHMLRLWLKDEEMAGTPPHPMLQLQWATIFDTSSRNAEGVEWPMDAELE